MRILIVNPRLEFADPVCHMRPGSLPSNVAAVAASLAPHCSDIQIFDSLASETVTCGSGGIAYGKSDSELIATLESSEFDAVGIPSPWTIHHKTVRAAARLIKSVNPRTVVFAGGHHITVCEPLEDFDFIVTGELENVAAMVVGVIGAHRRGDRSTRIVRGTPADNLDSVPFPAYAKMDLPFYLAANREHQGSVLKGGVPVTTSRGCPYRCMFCAVHLSMGHKWRPSSPARVLEHLAHLKSLGFGKFYFEDDNLTMDKKRWSTIMQGMSGQGYQWTAPNGVRLDTLDPEFLALAAGSGCKEIKVSIESSVDDIRNRVVAKNLTLQNIESVATCCRESDIKLGAFFMIGIPGESLDDIRKTLLFARRLRDDFGVRPICSIATPFPGTDMYRQCIEQGLLDRDYTPEALVESLNRQGFIKTDLFTPGQVAQLRDEILA